MAARPNPVLPPFEDETDADLLSVLKNLNQTAPTLANFSQTLGDSAQVLDELMKIVQSGIIPVVSMENSYPRATGTNLLRANVIRVGSLNPLGFQSDFVSQDTADILVPSDQWLVYRDGASGYAEFSRDSGAAPQVSGVLSKVASILPGLSVDEARELAQKTAVPTLSGPGILNAYKNSWCGSPTAILKKEVKNIGGFSGESFRLNYFAEEVSVQLQKTVRASTSAGNDLCGEVEKNVDFTRAR